MNLVLAHGTFDLLHVGHMRMLEWAKEQGNYLVVSITADRFVNKGPGRPVFGEEERAYAIRRLRGVDAVYVNQALNGVPAILKYRPDIYVKGGDYKRSRDANLALERAAVEKGGGRLVIYPHKHYSSTELICRAPEGWRECHAI